jgi:hypothetical protein
MFARVSGKVRRFMRLSGREFERKSSPSANVSHFFLLKQN